MALQQVFEKTSISSNCNTLVFSDVTGDYDPTFDPHGYGAPNATRASLYMQVFVNLRLNSGRQPIDVPTYDKNVASTWTVTLSQDGWYEIYAFSSPVYDAGTTYATDYITYDLSSDAYYISLQDGNIGNDVSDTAYWKVTTDIEDFINAGIISQPGIYDVTLNDVELCRSVKCKGLALFQAAEQCDCDDNDGDCVIQPYEKIRLRVEAAQVAAALENYTDAQEFIDDITRLCVKCNCACN